MAGLREAGAGAEEALRAAHQQEQQALEDALGERLRAEVRPSAHLRSLRIEQRSLTRAKKFAEAMELMKMTEGLAREEAEDHRERVRRAHMTDLQQLFDRQAEERLVLQQKIQDEEELAQRRMAQGTSPRGFAHSPPRQGNGPTFGEPRPAASRQDAAGQKASARTKGSREVRREKTLGLGKGKKNTPSHARVSPTSERAGFAASRGDGVGSPPAQKAEKESWELYTDMSWKSPSTEWDEPKVANKMRNQQSLAGGQRKRYGLSVTTAEEGTSLLSPSEMLADGLSSLGGRAWSPKPGPMPGPVQKAKVKPRPGLTMPPEPAYPSPRSRARQHVRSKKQTEFDKVMDAVARLASDSPSPSPRPKRKVKTSSRSQAVPSSRQARTPTPRGKKSASLSRSVGDASLDSRSPAKDSSSPSSEIRTKKTSGATKGGKKKKVKKKSKKPAGTSRQSGGSSGAPLPSYMRPTQAQSARSLETANCSEDGSLDFVLDLDPWDDDVISSFRDGLSLSQQADELGPLQSTQRSKQAPSLAEALTPSPRMGDPRPSFWEESSPSDASIIDRNLCLSPPSDSASPLGVDFGNMASKLAVEARLGAGGKFPASLPVVSQRSGPDSARRDALDRAMDLVLERTSSGGAPPPEHSVPGERPFPEPLPADGAAPPPPVQSYGPGEKDFASGGGFVVSSGHPQGGVPPPLSVPGHGMPYPGVPAPYQRAYINGVLVAGQYAPPVVYGGPLYGVPPGVNLVSQHAPLLQNAPPAAVASTKVQPSGSQQPLHAAVHSRVAPHGPDSDALNARPDGQGPSVPVRTAIGRPHQAPSEAPQMEASVPPRAGMELAARGRANAEGGVFLSRPTADLKPELQQVPATRTTLTVAPGDDLHRGSAAGIAHAESSDSDDFDENDFDLVSPAVGRSLTSHSVPGLRVTSRVPLAPTELHAPRPKPRSPKPQVDSPPCAPRLIVAEAAAPPKIAAPERQGGPGAAGSSLSLKVPALHSELAALAEDASRGDEVSKSLSDAEAARLSSDIAPAQRAAAAAAALAAAKHWSAPPAPRTGALGTPLKYRPQESSRDVELPATPVQPIVKEGPGERAGDAASPVAKKEGFALEDIPVLFTHLRHGRYSEARAMIKHGVPVDCRDRGGNTPLMVSCQNGRGKLVKLCIRHGANVNAQNKQGNTALHFALAFQFQAIGEFLVAKGADDSLVNMKGFTCYEGLGKD